MNWKEWIKYWDYYAKMSALGMAALAVFGGVLVWLMTGGWFSIFLGLVWFVFCGYYIGVFIEDQWLNYKFSKELDSFENNLREALNLRADKLNDPSA